jgi:hypothetical protein
MKPDPETVFENSIVTKKSDPSVSVEFCKIQQNSI